MRGTNLTIRFLLELCMLAAFAYWGQEAAGGAAGWALGAGSALAAAVVWGLLIAPKAQRRLPEPRRMLLEAVLFGLAALALVAAGEALLGVALFAAFAVNRALLIRLGE
jgi:hypothetical protein